MDILDLRRILEIKIKVKEEFIIEATTKIARGLDFYQEHIDRLLIEIRLLKEILKEIDDGIQKMIDAIEKEKV